MAFGLLCQKNWVFRLKVLVFFRASIALESQCLRRHHRRGEVAVFLPFLLRAIDPGIAFRFEHLAQHRFVPLELLSRKLVRFNLGEKPPLAHNPLLRHKIPLRLRKRLRRFELRVHPVKPPGESRDNQQRRRAE